MENKENITLNFCEKCRKKFSFKNLKRTLHNELLCKECFALSESSEVEK